MESKRYTLHVPLSYSQLRSYRTCPKQYEYTCIKKIERPLSAPESFGVSMHSVLKRWGELEMKANPEKQNDQRLQLFTDDDHHQRAVELSEMTLLTLWREAFVGAGYVSRVEQDAALLRGEEALKKFFVWWNEKSRRVLAIEKGFKLSIPNIQDGVLVGRFDRVEETDDGLEIIDFKTGKPITEEELAIDTQLSIYALAAEELWHKPVTSLVLLSVREEACTPQRTTRNKNQLKDALKTIKILEEGIASGDFRPTPSLQVCRHCPYRDICPASASPPTR